jgi:hypothetical protein
LRHNALLYIYPFHGGETGGNTSTLVEAPSSLPSLLP